MVPQHILTDNIVPIKACNMDSDFGQTFVRMLSTPPKRKPNFLKAKLTSHYWRSDKSLVLEASTFVANTSRPDAVWPLTSRQRNQLIFYIRIYIAIRVTHDQAHTPARALKVPALFTEDA
jgi:hypothetical protein